MSKSPANMHSVMSSEPMLGAGLAFKPEYAESAVTCQLPGLWYEVHAENYLQRGGPRHALLQRLAERHPLSIHGVGLSLASSSTPDAAHLQALQRLVAEFQPALVSEHLAWSVWQGHYVPDLLPVPRTHEALQLIARNIDITQQAQGRRLLIENPSHYLPLPHAMSEGEFLSELVQRTGCGLLLDLNNVFVSCHNLGADPSRWLADIPADAVGEIHLAGHAPDAGGSGLLIDTHGASIAEPVWQLFEQYVEHHGPCPTLIERDQDLPAFAELLRERQQAQSILNRHLQPSQGVRHVAG